MAAMVLRKRAHVHDDVPHVFQEGEKARNFLERVISWDGWSCLPQSDPATHNEAGLSQERLVFLDARNDRVDFNRFP